MLNINQVAFGLGKYVLGATDQRMGVWVQGCSLKCAGCSSLHTWANGKGKHVSVDTLIKLAKAQTVRPTGLTISGGEPSSQSTAVLKLVRAFREAFPGTEVGLFTGLTWSEFYENHRQLVEVLDVVVAGPYEQTLAASPMAGSSNQEVKLLTGLAAKLYHDWVDWPIHRQQLAASGIDSVVTVGIPDTQRMARAADQSSVLKVTWQKPLQKTAPMAIKVVEYE
jgi:anaerobic ribonucleoside-triphosphate reductase activating protein